MFVSKTAFVAMMNGFDQRGLTVRPTQNSRTSDSGEATAGGRAARALIAFIE